MQKVASVKGPRKTERKGAANKIEKSVAKKKQVQILAYAHALN